MKNYSVKQYIIFKVENGYAIQNETSFTVITDKKIIDFFLMLDKENRLMITQSYIDDYFGDSSENVIEFLIESNIMEHVVEKKLYKTTYIYTNDHVIYEGLEFFTEQSKETFKVIYSTDINSSVINLKENGFDSEGLYFIIQNPFDYIDFVNITDNLRELQAYTVVCFAYNSTLYMSNLYKKEWYNPCPKCFFSNIETSLRAKSKVTANTTFQTIVDLIYNKETSFQVCLPTRKDNIVALLNEIINYKNVGLNYLANRVSRIYLDGTVEYDQCSHWELCDCFE